MSCSQANFGYCDQSSSGGSAGSFDSAVASPYLIVSNCPETLTSVSGPLTLYKGELPIVDGRRFRLWLWHINNAGKSVTFGLRVHVNGTATLTNIKRDVQVANFADLSVQGICEAKAHLLGTLDSVAGTISLTSASTAVWTQSVPDTTTNGSVIACCMEFDTTSIGNGADTMSVRTFVTDSGDQGSYNDEPGEGDNHPRGWWPRSSARFLLNTPGGEFDCKASIGDHESYTLVCNSGGPEHNSSTGFGPQSGNGHTYDSGDGNKGCYGVDLIYVCKIVNSSASASNCYVSIRSKDGLGAKYWGAAKAAQPLSLDGKGIRKLPYSLSDSSHLNSVNPFEGASNGRIAVSGNSEVDFELRVGNGGGATLPCIICLSAPSFKASEAEDPIED